MNFKKCLSFGEKYQYELVKILNPTNFKMMDGYFKEYDLIIDDLLPIYYEVKADKYAYYFSQFCIEYECNKKPSGISTTTADYYAYFVVKPFETYELYIIPVIDIKEAINNNKYATIKEGGDRNASKFYIIDFKLFSKYKRL
jgi:hypothetical protein